MDDYIQAGVSQYVLKQLLSSSKNSIPRPKRKYGNDYTYVIVYSELYIARDYRGHI
ncbi:hypothetical protein H634G_11405 [Metarhizium anisopliae BRIP 53293]|uniref:Uncharacterized protein n=1 Tax=Metarhizium anisopliae BRIP 53293 TaxID=1291518 RepID=A0A0D9NHA3_METAN|nr:hypothetical protein H634G_11405 [Metarhizium anisopliae BRIP 53293]